MKTRIFKKEDGSVIYSTPQKKYQGGYFFGEKELTFADCNFGEFSTLPYIDVDTSDLVESDSNTGNYHEMIYFDGPCHKDNLKQDKTWDAQLMPSFLVKEKYLSRLNSEIDLVLSKENSEANDVLEILKINRQKDVASKNNDPQFWLEKSIEGLDERVAKGEPDKPKIRQRLEALIQAKK